MTSKHTPDAIIDEGQVEVDLWKDTPDAEEEVEVQIDLDVVGRCKLTPA